MTQPSDRTTAKAMDFQEFMRFVWRGARSRWLIALLAGATAFLLTRRQSPIYRATASLLATQPGTTYAATPSSRRRRWTRQSTSRCC